MKRPPQPPSEEVNSASSAEPPAKVQKTVAAAVEMKSDRDDDDDDCIDLDALDEAVAMQPAVQKLMQVQLNLLIATVKVKNGVVIPIMAGLFGYVSGTLFEALTSYKTRLFNPTKQMFLDSPYDPKEPAPFLAALADEFPIVRPLLKKPGIYAFRGRVTLFNGDSTMEAVVSALANIPEHFHPDTGGKYTIERNVVQLPPALVDLYPTFVNGVIAKKGNYLSSPSATKSASAPSTPY